MKLQGQSSKFQGVEGRGWGPGWGEVGKLQDQSSKFQGVGCADRGWGAECHDGWGKLQDPSSKFQTWGSLVRGWAWVGVWVWMWMWLGLGLGVGAAEGSRTFRLAGGTAEFDDVTGQVRVRFAGMRWSRFVGAWQAEVTVANVGAGELTGALLLAVAESRGTSGPGDADNVAGSPAEEPRFWDLSGGTGDGVLAPGETTRARSITLGRLGNEAPVLSTRVYVAARTRPVEEPLAFTRVLDGEGRPMGGARVTPLLPAGAATLTSDPEAGAVSLGGKPGEYRWRFEAEGYLPVWRTARLEALEVVKLSTPRLTRRSGWVIRPTTGGGWREITNRLRVDAGTFAGGAAAGSGVEVTVLESQALPFPLPLGWSLQRAWWAEAPGAWPAGTRVGVRTEDVFPATPAPVVLARFDAANLAWRVVENGSARESDWIEFALPEPAAYAVVSADAEGAATQGAVPVAVPIPVPGVVLPERAARVVDVSGWLAWGRVRPGAVVASTNVVEVRGMAELEVTNRLGSIPSGTALRAWVREEYRLADGSVRAPMGYEASLTLRRRVGRDGASSAFAEFPLRPGLLMGAARLEEARITAEILPEAAFAGGVVGGVRGDLKVSGLVVSTEGPANQPGRAVEVGFETNAASLGDGVAAFALAAGMGGPGDRWRVRFDPAPQDGNYVLARRWYEGAETGLEPVAAWTVGGGTVSESTTDGAAALSGVDRSGQYVLVRVTSGVGIVAGTLRDAAGAAVRGAEVRVAGTPWGARTDAAGGFRLVAGVGDGMLVTRDPVTGEAASRAFTMPATRVAEAVAMTTAAAAPFVAEVVPAAGAVDVGLLTPVVVRFSKAVRVGGGGPGVELLDARSNAVPARLEWEDEGRVARLIASNELAEATAHVVRVGATVEDARGNRLIGAREFGFTTVARKFERAAGAQLVSEAPDANGEAWVRGSPGMGLPRQPILFVNGTTGRTSSGFTEPDGSFAQRLAADEGDRLSVVLVHPDGTRSTYPVGRQLFPDGSVALFSEGGRVTNRNDDLQIVLDVPAGAVLGRTRFRLTPLRAEELGAATQGTAPEDATLFGGFDLAVEGDAVQGKVRIEVRPEPGRWVPPPGRTLDDLTLMATAFREITEFADGAERTVPVYEYLSVLTPAGAGAGGAARALSLALAGRREPAALFAGFYAFVDPAAARVMLVGNVYYSNTELIGQTTSALFRGGLDADPDTDVPLGGAVVRARALSALNSRPFSLQGGELVVTSGGDGRFAFLVPEQTGQGSPGQGHVLTATHPSFPRQFATSSAGTRFDPIHPFGGGKIRFNREATPDTTPPSITVLHRPVQPAPGDRVGVRVEAVDESGPASSTLTVESVEPATALVTLVAGLPGAWEVTANAKAKVVLRARATDAFGNSGETLHVVRVGDPPAPLAPVNDPLGPRVLYSQPDEGAMGVDPLAEFRLRFSEWVSPDLARNPSQYVTLSPAGGPVQASMLADPREVTLRFPALENGREYVLNVAGVQDLTGQYLDQDPTTSAPTNEPFVLRFRTAPAVLGALSGVTEGGGVAVRGAYAYVLDRREQTLNRYDVSIPARPVRLDARALPGPARAMVLVPDYQYTLAFEQPGVPGSRPGAVKRGDLIVVAGQTQGAAWGYIRVYELGENFAVAPHVAGGPISMDETALLTRLSWSAPYLLLTENSAFAPQVHVLNLQSLLLGDAYREVPRDVLDTLPPRYQPGRDLNLDGDFVDAGEALPVQGQDTLELVVGEEAVLSLAPNRTTDAGAYHLVRSGRYITDAVADGAGSLALLLTTSGIDQVMEVDWRPVRTNTWNRPAALRAYVIGGASPDTALPPAIPNGYVLEFPGWYPKRLLPVPSALRRLVLVNLISADNATNSLRIIDASRPDFLVEAGEIPLPVSEYGLLQGAELDDRGRVALSLARPSGMDLVFLDVAKLLAPVGASGVHPAILGRISGAGAGVTPFAVLGSGVTAASLRNLNVVSQSAPWVRLLPAGRATAEAMAVIDPEERFAALRALVEPPQLPVIGQGTNAALPATDPAFRWHVMVEAPGGAGSTIRLAVMSLGPDGTLAAGTNSLLASFDDAVVLHRLSHDALSPAFNAYVSGPLSLADDASGAADLQPARGVQVVLRAGSRVRVGIPESMAPNPVLGPFSGLGTLVANPPPNAAPVRLGASVARPVSVLSPSLNLETPVVVRTTVDRVNQRACPGSAWLEFEVNPDAEITILLDGRPLTGGLDELGRSIPVFTNVAFTAGSHRVLVDAAHLPRAGEFPVEAVGTRFAGLAPDRTLTVSGMIEHEVEMNHSFPIGHAVIQGVDLWDGHLTHARQDVAVPGRKLALDFSRTYSSSGNGSAGPLGAGWTHNHHIRLEERCGVFTVVGGEGTGHAFVDPVPDPVREARYARFLPAASGRWEFFRAQVGYHSVLARDTGRPAEAWYFTKSAVRYHFLVDGSRGTSSGRVFPLQSVREPNGNELRLAYEDGDANRETLDTVTEFDPTGLPKRGFRFEYRRIAGADRMVALRGFNRQGSPDLLGLEIRYAYDDVGHLTNVTRVGASAAETRTDRYVYTPEQGGPNAHNLVEWTDPNGMVTRYEYFPTGAAGYYALAGVLDGVPPHEMVRTVTRVGAARPGFEAAADAVTRFTYDFAGGTRRVSDPRAAAGVPDTVYVLNAYGATLRIEAPLGQTTTMEWATDHLDGSVRDEAGQPVRDVLLTRKVDAEGLETRFEYHDGRGNVTRETTRVAPGKTPVFDRTGAATTTSELVQVYHPVFNVPLSVVDAEGSTTTFAVDDATGNLVRSEDAAGNVTTFEYQPGGDVRVRRDPRGHETRFTRYDAYGNAEVVVDPEGNQVEQTYDERSRLRESRDTFTHHRRIEYDGLDRVISEVRLNDLSGLGGGPDARTGTSYLAGGLVRFQTNALGLVTAHEYDALGRRVRSVQRDVRQVDGSRVSYTNSWQHDVVGNVLRETDARGVTRTHAYDALSRRERTVVSGPHGGPGAGGGLVSAVTFDRVNNTLSEINRHGLTNRYEYDGFHRQSAHHLPVAGARLETRRDRIGNVLRSTDANGRATGFQYDRLHRLVRRTDPEGNATEFGYDAAGNRTLQHDHASGLVTTNAFDRIGRPTLAVLNGPGVPGYVTRTRYDDARNEIRVTNARGFASRVRKDGLDRLVEQVVAEGVLDLTNRMTHDAAGNVLEVVDARNGDVDLVHAYDELGRRLSTRWVATPDDQGRPVTEELAYDGAGQAVWRRDRRGFEHRATFDNLGRPRTQELRESVSGNGAWLVLAETVYDDAANAQDTYDAARNRARIEFDGLGRPRSVRDPVGRTLSTTYDGVNPTVRVDGRGQRTTTVYDGLNRPLVVREFDAAGVERSSITNVYRDSARRREMTDRNGRTTVVEVDALGRETGVWRSGGNLAARYGADPLRLSRTEYDGNSNLVRTEDGDGRVVTHEYDAADRRTASTEGAGTAVAATTRFEFDAVGNVVSAKDPRAHGAAHDVRHEYDARNRRIATSNALGETTRQHYDAANNVVERIDPRGGRTRYEYDELNALLAVDESARGTAADAGVTRFRYDATRNRVAQQDPDGNLVTREFDGLNRMTAVLQHAAPGTLGATANRGAGPGGNAATAFRWTYGYDGNGNPALLVDPRGQRIETSHDHLNRVVQRIYTGHAERTAGNPAEFQPLRIEWVRDGNGNELEIRETKQLGAAAVTERTVQAFDALDRLMERTRHDHDDVAGRRLGFRYDVAGNRTESTDADGRVTRYAYDDRNRLETVTLDAGTGAGALTVGYGWETDGLLRRVDYPGGVSASRAYDAADRLLSITNAAAGGGTVLSSFGYRYDANGNRLEQVEFNPGLGPVPETTRYGYDGLNRLTAVTNGAGASVRYTYAPNGNRLTERGTDFVTGQPMDRVFRYGALPGVTGTFDGMNALTRIEDLLSAARTITYRYDSNLNQVSREQDGIARRFRHDIRDRMIETGEAEAWTRFDYGADRMRVKKISAAGETRYLYDQAAVALEYGPAAAGHVTLRTYDQGGSLLAMGTPRAAGAAGLDRHFYLTDALGSTVHLTAASGAREAEYRYDAWGRLTASASTVANERQFTGHYRDAETGLHYFGARYYDDEQGRFLGQDAFPGEAGTPASLHRYLYAFGNPLAWVDPTGYANEKADAGGGKGGGGGGDDSIREDTGTKKGRSDKDVDPSLRNTVIDSETGEHYVPWWSDRKVIAEARKEAKEAAAQAIRELEQSLDRADKYNEAYLEWSVERGQAEARASMAKVKQLEALVATGGSGDKLQYFTDQLADMVATAGDDPGWAQAVAAGVVKAVGQYVGGALNVGSGLGTLSGKLAVEDTTGVAPSGWDYLAAGADVMQIGGTVGGALANVARASRVREARTAIQSVVSGSADRAEAARALLSPAGLVDDASRLGAVTGIADTWIGRTLRSDEVLTEVVPRVRFDGPILTHLFDPVTKVMSQAELVAAKALPDVAKILDLPERLMGSAMHRLQDIGVGVIGHAESLRLGKPLSAANPARILYDKIILVHDDLVAAAQNGADIAATGSKAEGTFRATDVLRRELIHEVADRAIRSFEKAGMSRPMFLNLEVEDVLLRRIATENPDLARRLGELIGTGKDLFR